METVKKIEFANEQERDDYYATLYKIYVPSRKQYDASEVYQCESAYKRELTGLRMDNKALIGEVKSLTEMLYKYMRTTAA